MAGVAQEVVSGAADARTARVVVLVADARRPAVVEAVEELGVEAPVAQDVAGQVLVEFSALLALSAVVGVVHRCEPGGPVAAAVVLLWHVGHRGGDEGVGREVARPPA